MTKLPLVSGDKAAKAFMRAGYYEDRQKGSHLILRHPEKPEHNLSIPLHKELGRGFLSSLVKDSGMTVE
jgi:predicted RNA binding protein YcfA (HicA-like mRNA interferase family)